MLKADRLKRLWTFALAAPSHARVVITYQGNGKAYPICGKHSKAYLSEMHQPAGFCHRSLAAPRAESGAPPTPTFFTEGEGGAGLAIARLGRVPSWLRTGHEASKGFSLG